MHRLTAITDSRQVASDVDLFSHALLEDPYPVLRELRDLGGAV